MNTSRLRSVLAAFLFALTSAAASAETIVWTPVAVDGSGGFVINGVARDITPTATSPMMFAAQNITPQQAEHIHDPVEQAFGLAPGTLVTVASCDSGSCFSQVGNVFTGTSSTAFDYLAIHLGQMELAFHFATPITQFVLTGFTNVSNFRAFSAIPLPGAFALFLGAMAFFGMMRRRFGFGQPAVPALA